MNRNRIKEEMEECGGGIKKGAKGRMEVGVGGKGNRNNRNVIGVLSTAADISYFSIISRKCNLNSAESFSL